MFNGTRQNIDDFINTPNVGTFGGMNIQLNFWQFALNETTGETRGFLDFQNNIRESALCKGLVSCNFTSIIPVTFEKNKEKATAIGWNEVRKTAMKSGFMSIISPMPEGIPKPGIVVVADDLWNEENDGRQAGCGGPGSSSDSEFDAKTGAAKKRSLDDMLESIGEGFTTVKKAIETGYEPVKASTAKAVTFAKAAAKASVETEKHAKVTAEKTAATAAGVDKLWASAEAKDRENKTAVEVTARAVQNQEGTMEFLTDKNERQAAMLAILNQKIEEEQSRGREKQTAIDKLTAEVGELKTRITNLQTGHKTVRDELTKARDDALAENLKTVAANLRAELAATKEKNTDIQNLTGKINALDKQLLMERARLAGDRESLTNEFTREKERIRAEFAKEKERITTEFTKEKEGLIADAALYKGKYEASTEQFKILADAVRVDTDVSANPTQRRDGRVRVMHRNGDGDEMDGDVA
jgi:hypothetical protein